MWGICPLLPSPSSGIWLRIWVPGWGRLLFLHGGTKSHRPMCSSVRRRWFPFRKRSMPLLGQVKKKPHVSRPDFCKKESGRAFFWLFIISYCILSLHIIVFPQGYVEALRSNINKTNIRYWLNTSLFNFDIHKGLTVKIYIILVCTQQQWASQGRLLVFAHKNVAHKKIIKKERRR